MLLSIITVNLNDALGLEKTINSVIKQSFTDFEHIVIDGKSTDGSIAVIEQKENEYKSINGGIHWISEHDLGIYNAMNKGIKMAKGDYCLFLNSGDWLLDNNTLANINLQEQNNGILYGDIIYIDGNRSIKRNLPEKLTINTFLDGSLYHPSTFIKRELFNKYGNYNEKFKIVSDYDFFLRMFANGKVTFEKINQVISKFPLDGLSGDSKHKKQHDQERKRAKEQIAPQKIWQELNRSHLMELEYNSLKKIFFVKVLILLKKLKQRLLN